MKSSWNHTPKIFLVAVFTYVILVSVRRISQIERTVGCFEELNDKEMRKKIPGAKTKMYLGYKI